MSERTALSIRLHKLADEGHERAAEMREKADAFDNATWGFFAEPQTVDVKKFMGCFARDRRLWCDLTGEPLV